MFSVSYTFPFSDKLKKTSWKEGSRATFRRSFTRGREGWTPQKRTQHRSSAKENAAKKISYLRLKYRSSLDWIKVIKNLFFDNMRNQRIFFANIWKSLEHFTNIWYIWPFLRSIRFSERTKTDINQSCLDWNRVRKNLFFDNMRH